MSRFANLPWPSFARCAGPDEQPHAGKLCRGMSKRTAMLHEAAAVLDLLPAPGETLHALITGRYDLMHLLVALLAVSKSVFSARRREAGSPGGPASFNRATKLEFTT